MNIQKYTAFIKTVECGSFTKAAEILNYSQSGISRMIGDLEKDWNVTLLERNKNGVRLTSDGLTLLPYAKNLVADYEKLQSAVDELNGLQTGIIRIGTFSSAATHWLPNIIKEFRKDFPNIDYELLLGNYEETEEQILNGRVDCGFLRLPTHADLETIFLEQDPLMAVIPEDHPLKDCEKFPVAALCEEPFIFLGNGQKNEISEIFDRCNLKPSVCFTTWDDYAIMSMVEKGLGISILPKLILKRAPYKIIVKELDVQAHRNIGLAFRDKKSASLAAKRFIEYLKFR